MGSVKSFRDLRVWQRSMDLVPEVYLVARQLPATERYGLSDQLRRAVVSIPANIAEGHARVHTKEYLHHLSIARGSLAEVLTLLMVAQRLDYLKADRLAELEQSIQETRRQLCTLMTRLQPRARP